MSELEKAVVALIDVFHQYSGREGDKHKLKKSELKELINSELSHFLEEIKEQEVVDKVMETLDSDGDGECDFQEFMAFVAMVTTACHEFLLNTSELEKTDTQFLQRRRAHRAGQWRQGFGRTVGAELSGCVVAN
ncbi:protein S100-B-like [Sus scrofa]|uniref:Protein S100 n=1 Tax=Sus scrofa TaxID=9823 RepID=A0A286ZP11_PIG|nr:protein S100-B-like [Sus scrofa]